MWEPQQDLAPTQKGQIEKLEDSLATRATKLPAVVPSLQIDSSHCRQWGVYWSQTAAICFYRPYIHTYTGCLYPLESAFDIQTRKRFIRWSRNCLILTTVSTVYKPTTPSRTPRSYFCMKATLRHTKQQKPGCKTPQSGSQ